MAVNPEPHVLIVAGSDSSGGAGVVRDIETVSAFGVKSAVAVTAVTAQTHGEVLAVHSLAPELVDMQMRAALQANRVVAIKVGMLASAEIVECVANLLAGYKNIPMVLDPVLVSSSGTPLLEERGIRLLLERLLPMASLVTPNLPELDALADVLGISPAAKAADKVGALLAMGAGAVLVKGGHGEGEMAVDTLFRVGQPPRRYASRRHRAAMRGTGCMLASAIAAGCAKGETLEAAIGSAKAFMEATFSRHGESRPAMVEGDEQ